MTSGLKPVARITIGVLLVIIVFFFWEFKREKYRDNHVVAGELFRPINVLNVHGASWRNFLKVNGTTYKGVRGSRPYFLEVPELDALLFVTEEKDARTLHLFNVKTKQTTEIPINGRDFGSNIGFEQFGRKRGEPFTDYVEKINGNKMHLAHRSGDWKETLVINLSSRKVERTEFEEYGENGTAKKR